MASTPPASPPAAQQQRPMSALLRSNRSSSRMSMSSKHGGSRASDEDGKTAVKVAIRVRPPLQSTDPGFELIPQRFRSSAAQVTSSTNLAVESAQGKKLFVFDRVFGEDVDQEGVWEYLNESVGSFIQGYNVSILAYGQSGAGKSYTMGTSGPSEQSDSKIMGVIPRAAAALFEKLTGNPQSRIAGSGLRAPARYSTAGLGALQNFSKNIEKNWTLKATYVEIYQEQLRDLLLPESVPPHERNQVTIREDPKGRIILTGLHQATINSIEDLLNALNFGSAIRQTDATAINARSSRSHAVFSLNLVQKRTNTTSTKDKRRSVPIEAMSGSESWVTVDSKLHFVDLAGSERLKNTGAQGERAKEGISINAGLASLGKVISQLSSRSSGSHVSYRDSKLTRLLQDSLGGSAITYMVACINPAEFHLSETLNTVQYAQRARAIQSKPQIQQVSDDSDKQAVIDRLRAEVSFLRDQIRLSERTERRNNAPQERAERQHEREMELQNQLLDIQENYNALSQRHAKLISEITKTRGGEPDETLKDTIGESALDRLQRSNSFAEGVEQLVLEYEKTIQSLEASLSQTRASLHTSESSLMEKETNIAYMETLQQQLQARIQKAMDREGDSENYMRELEARLDGIASGEEKSSAVIQELRKELARTKENESSCEEYITTLEERLAEAEQDHEMMQREIDRLEHVVERQRSIGKLDNLLYELDHIRHNDKGATAVNGHKEKVGESSHQPKASIASVAQVNGRTSPTGEAHGENQREVVAEEAKADQDPSTPTNERHDADKEPGVTAKELTVVAADEEPPQSPAQSRFVNDKLETVTQELFDLRVEHEVTLTDFEELQRKYQMALNTLAELQDAVDEAQATSGGLRSPKTSRPVSFLAHAGLNGHKKEDGQQSSSRTLSSELSLAGESTNTEALEETSTIVDETEPVQAAAEEVESEPKPQVDDAVADPVLGEQFDQLKKLHAEKEERMAELRETYLQLQEKHQDTLDYVEELKSEVQKAQMARPSSPTQVIRRKSSQQIVATDRATRSIASLRNMALESWEDDPDVIQNFELNLNAVMTELHMRSERIQALEGEVGMVRKEMESKMTIISGLTRERSSLKASSPLDISLVSQMRDQLMENENQLKTLQDSYASREQELQMEIERLRSSVQAQRSEQVPATPPATGTQPESPFSRSPERDLSEDTEHARGSQDSSADEVKHWKTKHLSAMESMKSSEKTLQKTIAELETALKVTEQHYTEQINTLREQSDRSAKNTNDIAEVQAAHDDVVSNLRKELDEHKTQATASAARLSELEESHANILKQVEEDSNARQLTEKELETHRGLVANLESQIKEHISSLTRHQEVLASLQDSHARELEGVNEQLLKVQNESRETLAKTVEEHEASTAALQSQLSAAQAELLDLVKKASAALNQETDAGNLHTHIENLSTERKSLLDQHSKAIDDSSAAKAELAAAQAQVKTLEGTVGELRIINEETLKELEMISEKERKSSRLVEELEEQLSNNYDQHQAANNRLSALQTERQAQLGEAVAARQEMEKELEEARGKISTLEMALASAKRNSHRESLDPRDIERSGSANSNPRKSTSHNSLPSPPPAIPLPPLPGSPPPTAAPTHPIPSPPTSRHQSKDIAQAQLVEDQEARIRTIEKHLFAEKQLTATLEEALTDLEASSTRVKSEMESWKKKCRDLEEEVTVMRKERQAARHSLQAVEEERNARMRVEAERAHLEARMAALNNKTGKKKKSTLNCF